LIYTPPPLDKVWLDEEGLCKRPQQLLDQRCWVKHQTQIKKQAFPTPQIDDAPVPAPHHPIISEDTSVCDNDDNPDDASSFDHQSYSNQREMHGLIMVAPIKVLFWITVQLLSHPTLPHLQHLLVLRRM
jgi:hypothetical protein